MHSNSMATSAFPPHRRSCTIRRPKLFTPQLTRVANQAPLRCQAITFDLNRHPPCRTVNQLPHCRQEPFCHRAKPSWPNPVAKRIRSCRLVIFRIRRFDPCPPKNLLVKRVHGRFVRLNVDFCVASTLVRANVCWRAGCDPYRGQLRMLPT